MGQLDKWGFEASVSGPLLFIMNCYDLDLGQSSDLSKFSDDTNVEWLIYEISMIAYCRVNLADCMNSRGSGDDDSDGQHAHSPEGMYTLPDGVLTKQEASNSSGCPWDPWYCTGAV